MSDAHKPNEDSSRSKPKPARKLPDPAICRARFAGLADYAHCLVDDPRICRYALTYGDGFLCRSPERKEIVARTEAKQRE
jgi:hypothetical protein